MNNKFLNGGGGGGGDEDEMNASQQVGGYSKNL
jgi:hypothetical protein